MDDSKFFDNVSNIACDDMAATITKGSRVSIAAAFFSMYAYNVLREQLENVDEFRFIYTSPHLQPIRVRRRNVNFLFQS